MTDVIVSDAGTTQINGTYIEDGTRNGKPRYYYYGTLTYNLSWTYDSGLGEVLGWFINRGLNDYYYSTDDVATPDLVTTWAKGPNGSLPAPTVTAASSGQSLTLTCAAGSYSQTGSACTLTYTKAAQNLTLSCGAGSYALTGTAATMTVQRNYTLTCDAGSYSQTGVDATFVLQRHFTLVCNAGSYTQTGTDISLVVQRNFVLACNSGSYLLTGTPVSLTSARTLGCVPGSYTLTGLEADLFKRLVIPCGAGSYILTGSDCTLIRTDNPSSIINHVMHYRRLMNR